MKGFMDKNSRRNDYHTATVAIISIVIAFLIIIITEKYLATKHTYDTWNAKTTVRYIRLREQPL